MILREKILLSPRLYSKVMIVYSVFWGEEKIESKFSQVEKCLRRRFSLLFCARVIMQQAFGIKNSLTMKCQKVFWIALLNVSFKIMPRTHLGILNILVNMTLLWFSDGDSHFLFQYRITEC